MTYIKAKAIYPVSYIRQNESWEKITEYFKKYDIKDKIMLDFEGVGFNAPWELPAFIELVKMKNVYLKLYFDKEVYNTVMALFISEGEDTDRLFFVEAPKVVKVTNVEKKVESNGLRLVNYFENKSGTYFLKVANQYPNISHYQTISFIEYAMSELIEKQGAKSFFLDFNDIILNESVLNAIGALINKMGELNIEVSVDLGTEDDYRHLALYEVAHTEISSAERFKTIRDTIKKYPNMVGILTQYKQSKKIDEFGRYGKGESSVSRIAIFKGLKKNKDNVVVAVFQTFNINYFFTKFHWYCEHGDEELEKLEYYKVEVTLPELGFLNSFLGKKYHFSEISQGSKEESIRLVTPYAGHICSVSVTIPERAKMVFDDWNIKYNEEQLNNRIESTLNKLGLPGYEAELEAKYGY